MCRACGWFTAAVLFVCCFFINLRSREEGTKEEAEGRREEVMSGAG